MHSLRVSLLRFLGEIPLPLWREEPKQDGSEASCYLSERTFGELPSGSRILPGLQQEWLPPGFPPSSNTGHK